MPRNNSNIYKRVMKTLSRKQFDYIKKVNPNWSSYLCFVDGIKGLRINRFELGKLFKKFVDKEDYFEDELSDIISYLAIL